MGTTPSTVDRTMYTTYSATIKDDDFYDNIDEVNSLQQRHSFPTMTFTNNTKSKIVYD